MRTSVCRLTNCHMKLPPKRPNRSCPAGTRAVCQLPRLSLSWGAGGRGWISPKYPDAEVVTETPISWGKFDGQMPEGWGDARLVLPNGGHILIDHKSYPGTDPAGTSVSTSSAS